jgi:cytochrome c biogenesis protein CcmG/thiol:disulfide interchange protein DsbE
MISIRTWCACALACSALNSTLTAAVAVGERAPPFVLPTAAGDTVALERLRGKVIYVDFWASWCGPCRRSFPWMNAMNRKYGSRGLAIVAINVDKKPDDAARFLSEMPAEFTVVYDAPGVVPAAYAVKGMPSAYVIDQSGNVSAVEQGFRDESRAMLEQKIRALLEPR